MPSAAKPTIPRARQSQPTFLDALRETLVGRYDITNGEEDRKTQEMGPGVLLSLKKMRESDPDYGQGYQEEECSDDI